MTPYEIVMLIELYCGRDLSAVDTPLREQTLRSFISNGLIEQRDGQWQGTERAKVYIDHLCSQPFPVSRWVIPDVTESESDRVDKLLAFRKVLNGVRGAVRGG